LPDEKIVFANYNVKEDEEINKYSTAVRCKKQTEIIISFIVGLCQDMQLWHIINV